LLTVGLWNMVARQRFQDTMTTLRSTVQSQYEEVRTSINERLGKVNVNNCGAQAVGTSGCLAIGKLIQFSGQDVIISYVILHGDASADSGQSDLSILKAAASNGNLGMIRSSSSVPAGNYYTSDSAVIPQTIRMQWGGEFASGWTIPPSDTGTAQKSSAIAILHSPNSGSILVFSFAGDAVGTDGVLIMANATVNQPVAIMIKNTQAGFAGAALCVGSGSSSTVVRTVVPVPNFSDFTGLTSPSANNLRSLCSV